jgi:purine-binding chemotaxis protein CheW
MAAPDKKAKRDEFLTFRLGGEEYAIDILQVQEIRANEKATRIASAPTYIKGVINLRGIIVPIVDLRVKFGFAEAGSVAPVVIILSIADRVIGVVVDAVSDVLALGEDEIRPPPDVGGAIAAGFIRGLAPLGDRLLIVFDIARLMMSADFALVSAQAA